MHQTSETTLYIAIKGTVLALDRANGEELWRTRLKGWSFVNLILDGGYLFASTRGEVFCLDPRTGDILWNNGLSGLGFGIVSFANASNAAAAQEERQRRQAAAASGGGAAT